jgi:hypothetical protein
MATDDSARKLELTFGGEGFADGRVPITLLADKLKALQSLLFHAAATVTHEKSSRRGQWANRYRNAVELRFKAAHHSELTIETELVESGTPSFNRDFDLGELAVGLAISFAAALERRDEPGLERIVGDRQERDILLRSVESLCPDSAEAYTLTIANGDPSHPKVTLTGETRNWARSLLMRQAVAEASSSREATIVGTLTKIHYDVAPWKIAVLVGPGNEVDCFYGESMRDQISNLCAGGMVEVIGTVTLDVEGRIKQLDKVTGVEPVSMEPVRISRFTHAGQSYRLREAVPFNVEFVDGVWEYSNDLLGVRGYAERRSDALHELHKAFDFAYQDIGQADEDSLIGPAVGMKREFQRLIEASTAGDR